MSSEKATRKVQLTMLALLISCLSSQTQADATGSHKVFNVTTYGASGNGTTDDTAAVQAALTAAGTNTGNTVYFPAGTYLVTNTVVATGVVLTGQNATVLFNGANASFRLSGNSPATTNLSFQGGTTTAFSAVYFYQASNFSATNNTFGTNISLSVLAEFCKGGTISANSMTMSNTGGGLFVGQSSNLLIQNNKMTTISGSTSAIYDVLCQNDSITGNTIQNQTNNQLITDVVISSSTADVVSNNTISGGYSGIFLGAPSSTTVTNNKISNVTGPALSFYQATNTSATNNTITNANREGVLISQSAGSCNVSTNVISNCGTAGVSASSGGNITVAQNAISNCGLQLPTPAVIAINEPGATAISVTGNQYKGNTTNVTDFIHVYQTSATVTGNKTNTLLPTQVGM